MASQQSTHHMVYRHYPQYFHMVSHLLDLNLEQEQELGQELVLYHLLFHMAYPHFRHKVVLSNIMHLHVILGQQIYVTQHIVLYHII